MQRFQPPFLFLVLLAVALLVGLQARDLVPKGPPGPLFKTLDEVEPRRPIGSRETPGDQSSVYRISESGSYYLSGNVVGAAGKHGIVIAASDVDLDLNGFTVRGAKGTLCGIKLSSDGEYSNISLEGGTVAGWGDHGVDLQEASSYSELRAVRAVENGGHGFFLGNAVKAYTPTAVANGLDGIHVKEGSAGSVWIGVMALKNGGVGMNLGAGAALDDCSATGNQGGGIVVGQGSTLSNCNAGFNQGTGLEAASGVAISHCAASSNTQLGIAAGPRCVLVETAAIGSPVGMTLGDGSRARGCVVEASQVGLQVGSNCRAYTLTITLAGNQGTALKVDGSGNRIEESHVSLLQGGTGFFAESPDNLFKGLSATGEGIHYALPEAAAKGVQVNGESLQDNLAPDANFSF